MRRLTGAVTISIICLGTATVIYLALLRLEEETTEASQHTAMDKSKFCWRTLVIKQKERFIVLVLVNLTHSSKSSNAGNTKTPPRQILVLKAKLICYMTESDTEKVQTRSSDLCAYLHILPFRSPREPEFTCSPQTCIIVTTQTVTFSVVIGPESADDHGNLLGTVPAVFLTAIVSSTFRLRSTLFCFCVLRLIAGACCSYRELFANASKSVGNSFEKISEQTSSLIDKGASAEGSRSSVRPKTLISAETLDFRIKKNFSQGENSSNPGVFPKQVFSQEHDEHHENNSRSGSRRISSQSKSEHITVRHSNASRPLISADCANTREKNQQGTTGLNATKEAAGKVKSRPKRNNSEENQPPPPRSCTLHLVADYLFFLRVGGSDVTETAVAMRDAVQEADKLFRRTDFDQDGVGDNVGFTIINVTVLQKQSSSYYADSHEATNPTLYLQSFSTANHSEACLAVIFTYIDFKGGVGGTAWLASSSPGANPGGICQKPVYAAKTADWLSFNTVLLTFKTGSKRVSRWTAAALLTAQLARSFGSSNGGLSLSDNCSSDSAVLIKNDDDVSTGGFAHDYRFSLCSLRLMYPVIVTRGTCLRRLPAIICGNGLREGLEECDCGNSTACPFIDPCCTPSDARSADLDLPCTFRRARGIKCSPLFSLCCSSRCRHVPIPGLECRAATDCRHRALCDGRGGECPLAPPKPNGTQCAGGTLLCDMGLCEGSACWNLGLARCRCNDPPGARCKLCCRTPGISSHCLPAEELGLGKPMYLSPGEHCPALIPALCNQDYICVPLHLLIPVSFADFELHQQWIENHWLYVIAVLVAFVLSLASFKVADAYRSDAHIKAVHYGKIIAIFRIATVVQLRIMKDIALSRYLLERYEGKVRSGPFPLRYCEAVSRIKTFFPTCPLPRIASVIIVAASEDVVVRVLLAQGFSFRRFTADASTMAHILKRPTVSQKDDVEVVSVNSGLDITVQSSLAQGSSASYVQGAGLSDSVTSPSKISQLTAKPAELSQESHATQSQSKPQPVGQPSDTEQRSNASVRTTSSLYETMPLFRVSALRGTEISRLRSLRFKSGLEQFREEVRRSEHSQHASATVEDSIKLVYVPVNPDDVRQVFEKKNADLPSTQCQGLAPQLERLTGSAVASSEDVQQLGVYALLWAWMKSWMGGNSSKRPATSDHDVHVDPRPPEGGQPDRPVEAEPTLCPPSATARVKATVSQTAARKERSRSDPVLKRNPPVVSFSKRLSDPNQTTSNSATYNSSTLEAASQRRRKAELALTDSSSLSTDSSFSRS